MSIADGPHYEVPSPELAAWVEQQGLDRWWLIDVDTYLTSRVSAPCRADELASVLRRANRPLLVTARDPQARGQVIGSDRLGELAERLGDNILRPNPAQPKPIWADDRCLWLCWKDAGGEWMLAENAQATAAFAGMRLASPGTT